MSVRQLCRFLGVGRLWLTNGRRDGYGPRHEDVDGRALYRRDRVREWLADRALTWERKECQRSREKTGSRQSCAEIPGGS